MEQLGRDLPPPRHETRCPREAPPKQADEADDTRGFCRWRMRPA